MKNSTYGVAYLLRKTNMTLTEIRLLEPDQFHEILGEVLYQESVVDYQNQTDLAHLIVAIANTVPRKPAKVYKVSDILKGDPPKRIGEEGKPDEKEELKALAEKFKIKLPGREMKEL